METNTEEKVSQMQVVTNDALSLITKAEIDIQISTAKAFPRSLKIFMDKAMSMATFSEDIAESCTYSLPRKKKNEQTGAWETVPLEGPSVRLAEIICACYGNIRAGSRTIANNGKFVTSQGICHDLETNNSRTTEVQRKITDKKGNTYSEDMQIVTANAAGAIAYRNAVFSVVPAALVEPIWEAAKKVAKGTAETLVKRREKAVEWFKSQGVKEDQLCTVLELKKIEDIDLEKLASLSSMRAAIKNGETTIKDLFEAQPDTSEPTDENWTDLKDLLDLKKESIKLQDVKDITRIIKDKEKNKYQMALKMLQSA